MNIIFNDNAKEALMNLIDNSSENYVRIKAFCGCGKPAFEVYADYKKETDIEVIIQGITFVIDKKQEIICNDIEIKYDKDVYNKGFYVKNL